MKFIEDVSRYQCKVIDEAEGFEEFFDTLLLFMRRNNFSNDEIEVIVHTLNSMYYTQPKIDVAEAPLEIILGTITEEDIDPLYGKIRCRGKKSNE